MQYLSILSHSVLNEVRTEVTKAAVKRYVKIYSHRPSVPLNPKGNSKIETLLVKLFSLKQKTNQILPTTIKKVQVFSLQENKSSIS